MNRENKSELAKKRWAAFLTIIGVLLVICTYMYLLRNGEVHRFFVQVHELGFIGICLAVAIQTFINIVPIPGEFTSVLLMELYGPIWGGFYSWLGGFLGAIGAYLLMGSMSKPFESYLKSSKVFNKVEHFVVKRKSASLLIVRILPIIPFHLINYMAGMLRLNLRSFIWTTAVGIIPFHVASSIVYAGVKQGSLVWGILGLAILALLAIVGWMVGKRYNALSN
ncbi:TVP38/TMEM64 family protein [Paenibacillus pini]|uniref:TVP38/TMEM64 family membrane protein n=1 Tax=Paenibacillus pini JCM 16418 TaxID=1236976 RepID=W7YZZ1_9BACL|nr:VTT domain-containing protein [Paenibacillus pini]GAF07954.1 hypothetical protein JCM16418_1988 [Paenibacillus pini JCM 16418]